MKFSLNGFVLPLGNCTFNRCFFGLDIPADPLCDLFLLLAHLTLHDLLWSMAFATTTAAATAVTHFTLNLRTL